MTVSVDLDNLLSFSSKDEIQSLISLKEDFSFAELSLHFLSDEENGLVLVSGQAEVILGNKKIFSSAESCGGDPIALSKDNPLEL